MDCTTDISTRSLHAPQASPISRPKASIWCCTGRETPASSALRRAANAVKDASSDSIIRSNSSPLSLFSRASQREIPP